jgi:hypothetical protein
VSGTLLVTTATPDNSCLRCGRVGVRGAKTQHYNQI